MVFFLPAHRCFSLDERVHPMLMLHRHPALQFSHPLPYGAIVHENGVQFVVFSRSATGMRVLLYDKVSDREPTDHRRFQPRQRPLGRHLERVRARPRGRSALSFSGRGAVRPQPGPAVQPAGPADRPLRPGAGRPLLAVGTTASSGRRSAWWSTTSSIGKATATCGASCRRR